jgi:hypothetical protein
MVYDKEQWRYYMTVNELTVQGWLCDFAEVSGNKLFIAGAGINLIATATVEPPHPVNLTLALMVRIPWNATNQQHKLRIELISDIADGSKPVPINMAPPPKGEEEDAGKIVAAFNAGRSPNMQIGEETLMPIALPMFGLPLPNIGSYFFGIGIDGMEMDRISFRVTPVLHLQAGIGPGLQR